MVRTQKRMHLCVVLLSLNVLFIWGNSLLPGEYSAAFSRWVKELLTALLSLTPKEPSSGHGLLRKAAHFAEFACLGGLLAWLFAMVRKPAVLAVLLGFLTACSDETIQYFVPDRSASFWDVLLDTSGALVGVAILLGAYHIYKRRQR